MIYFLHGVEILLIAYLIWKETMSSTPNPQLTQILAGLATIKATQALQLQRTNKLKDDVDKLQRAFSQGNPVSAADLSNILGQVNALSAGAQANADALKAVDTDATTTGAPVPNPTSITTTPNPINLSLANSPTVDVDVLDSLNDDTTADCTYSTDDPTIATVDATGAVTAVAVGSTNLQVTDAFGNKQTVPVVVSA